MQVGEACGAGVSCGWLVWQEKAGWAWSTGCEAGGQGQRGTCWAWGRVMWLHRLETVWGLMPGLQGMGWWQVGMEVEQSLGVEEGKEGEQDLVMEWGQGLEMEIGVEAQVEQSPCALSAVA